MEICLCSNNSSMELLDSSKVEHLIDIKTLNIADTIFNILRSASWLVQSGTKCSKSVKKNMMHVGGTESKQVGQKKINLGVSSSPCGWKNEIITTTTEGIIHPSWQRMD